jgi:hypothetical protein
MSQGTLQSCCCGIPERVAIVAPHGLHDVVATACPRCRLPAPHPIKLVTISLESGFEKVELSRIIQLTKHLQYIHIHVQEPALYGRNVD